MKKFNNNFIIGIDHGYGNMKTANCCFPTGVAAYDKEPVFKDNMLVWNERYYLIGVEHKAFMPEKMLDEDYYVLTLHCCRASPHLGKRTKRGIPAIPFAE